MITYDYENLLINQKVTNTKNKSEQCKTKEEEKITV